MTRSSETDSAPAEQGAASFTMTRWSVVLAAGRSESASAHQALEQLCRTYWHPIYSFVRRQGHSPHDAQDLTQEFFARLLQKNYLGAVDRSKGRFRSFLLAALKHFLANEWDKVGAQKRGAHPVLIPIDVRSAETSYAVEPAENTTPETIFERRWALALLQQVLARLRAEYVREEKAKLFESLKSTLTGERHSVPYAQIGAELGMSEGAVKVTVHRLRQRYRELLREEIAHTVATPAEVEEEIRALFAALA
jgi:RNA polymerase sigma-70 factor (ECF subfamily)